MAPPKAPAKQRIGLIVNPIAGIGGRVGLKGSDGAAIQRRARELGAIPESGLRASRAIEALRALTAEVELLVGPSEMGEQAARSAGFDPVVVGDIVSGSTSADDTRRIARAMRDGGVDLLLFAGGDGTARDIVAAVARTVPVLGIPAGVKVYSAVFAINPSRAGDLAAAFLVGLVSVRDSEVLDLDEDAYRAGRVSPALVGYLSVPYRRNSVQGGKAPTPASERGAADAIALDVVERMVGDRRYILGPGTTTWAITEHLGMSKTLVGVDVVSRAGVVLADANERELESLAADAAVTVVVTPIGGQGFIFGRGNPQIGPQVLKHVRREDILVIATPAKLAALHGSPLLVDTGDPVLDAFLTGYLPVVTGYHERTMYRVST